MKIIIATLTYLLIVIKAFGTAQIPDVIIYKGDTLSLYACPLGSHPQAELMTPNNLFGSKGCFFTACWRNYIATWEIIDNELFLVEIRNACYPSSMNDVAISFRGKVDQDSIGNEYADLKAIFPHRFCNGKVKADWVNDKLYSPQGKLLYYIHDPFQSIYEKELEFTFENGNLLSTQVFDNSKTKESKYKSNEKLLIEFIYSNIKRENLPESDSIKRRVYVTIISADDNGKIDSVRIARGAGELYDKEAIRIIKSIPEWDVTYRHGKKVNHRWTIPIQFDLSLDEK